MYIVLTTKQVLYIINDLKLDIMNTHKILVNFTSTIRGLFKWRLDRLPLCAAMYYWRHQFPPMRFTIYSPGLSHKVSCEKRPHMSGGHTAAAIGTPPYFLLGGGWPFIQSRRWRSPNSLPLLLHSVLSSSSSLHAWCFKQLKKFAARQQTWSNSVYLVVLLVLDVGI